MADISQAVVNKVLVFTAVSDAGQAWMVKHYAESTVRYALQSDLERQEADRFRDRATTDGLKIDGSLSTNT